jgi:diguanylate cyclase (GGDEF)-like protein
MSDDVIGKVLDNRYEITECLGSGGMGVVYKARQRQLERIVAIKMPHLSNISSGPSRNRFEREAQTMAKFSHENIVQVYDYNAKVKRPYIVLEYIKGQELADLLSRPDQISIGGVLHVLRQIANGLDYAHKYGVIHRDIKPENIVIDDKRRCVKIMDFGLVRVEGSNSQDTRAGFVVGTPQYMSPEQVRAKPVGPPSDIYAVAVIVYCIFTGRLPFDGEGMALMMRHATEQPANPLDLNPFLPKAMEQTLLRSLDKNPDARHPTAMEMIDELDYALRDKQKYPYAALLRGDWDSYGEMMENELEIGEINEFPELEEAAAGTGEKGTIILVTSEERANDMTPLLTRGGYKTIRAKKAVAGFEYTLRHNPDAVLVEEDLPDMSGAALCRIMKANPATDLANLIYLGERSKLRTDRMKLKSPVQVIAADQSAENIANFTGALVRRVQEAKSEYIGTTEKIISQDGRVALAPILRRFDDSLLREYTTSNLVVGWLQATGFPSVFHKIGELIRPVFNYKFLYAGIFPQDKSEKGSLLIDKTDPTDNESAATLVFQIQQELKRRARGHKDTPDEFDTRFSRENVGLDGGSAEVSAISTGARFVSFPIEEGARLHGMFGVAFDGDEPNDKQMRIITEMAPLVFSALSSAWRAQQLNVMRDTDEVSGVWRRPRIMDYLELSLTNSNSLEEPYCLMMLDIDGLDNINETLGTRGGDRTLNEIGKMLKQMGDETFRAGRIGSDEFLVVMPGIAINDAIKMGRELVTEIKNIRLSDVTDDQTVSVSIGMAFRALEEKTSDYLLRAARNALRAVKSSGGGNVRASG